MPYKQTPTPCVVRLVRLRRLPDATLAQCHALRQEAGRLWTALVQLHAAARAQGQWLDAGDLEKATKGGQYALGSQTVQALCQKFAANVETTTNLRQQQAAQGTVTTEYPHHAKAYQTVIWKDQGLLFDHPDQIGLKNGLGRPSLYLPLPAEFGGHDIRRAELTWRADHYELVRHEAVLVIVWRPNKLTKPAVPSAVPYEIRQGGNNLSNSPRTTYPTATTGTRTVRQWCTC